MASFFLMLIAALLCGFSQNDGLIPVNKNLWSTSFITLLSGWGLIALSIFYVLIDMLKVTLFKFVTSSTI